MSINFTALFIKAMEESLEFQSVLIFLVSNDGTFSVGTFGKKNEQMDLRSRSP